MGHFAIMPIYYIGHRSIVAYEVLSVYRSCQVIENLRFLRKVSVFLYFFGWALQRGGRGPGKGPNLSILSRTPFYQFHKEHPKNTKF